MTDNQINNASNTEEVTRSLGKRWIGSVVDTDKPSQVKCENEPIWESRHSISTLEEDWTLMKHIWRRR